LIDTWGQNSSSKNLFLNGSWLCLSTNGLRVLTLQNTPHSKDWGVKQTKYLTDYTQETWMKPLKITRFVRKLDPTLHRKVFDLNKKSLKISKGKSETVYRRRTDNTMAKRKSTKGQKNDRRNIYTYKTKDRVTRTPLKTGGERRCSGSVSSSCSTRRCAVYLINYYIHLYVSMSVVSR
jgi:hypothetical protein